jgi:hypothetical protein
VRRWLKGTAWATVTTLLVVEGWLFWPDSGVALAGVALCVIFILARRSDRLRAWAKVGMSRPCGHCDCPLVDHASEYGPCMRSSCPEDCDAYTT